MVEYCANGDVHQYLKKHQSDLSWLGEPDGGTSIEYVTRLRIASDVANGMNHLAAKEVSIFRNYSERGVLPASLPSLYVV